MRKLVGENTRFIYGIGGQLVAEFDGSTGNLKKEYVQGGATLITIEPTAVNSNGTRYTTADHLGTPRVITNSSAGVVSRHDYMPFGVELGAGVGGRTIGMGFSVADGVRQKFTSKERDNETGLDYFLARYYSSLQGRFTSVDPLLASARVSRPQSWNRYAYVLNNPLRLVDPTGMSDQDPKPYQCTPGTLCERTTTDEALRRPPMVVETVTVTAPSDTSPIETTQVSPEGPTLPSVGSPSAPNQVDDFQAADISVNVGYELGATFRQDRLGRCFFGVHGGAGLGLFPVSASFTSGQVFDARMNRASDPDTIISALTGWSVGTQATLPTTDVIGVAGSADPVVGVFPTGGPVTAEAGRGTGIPSASAHKAYAFKVPKWLMFPVQRITRCN